MVTKARLILNGTTAPDNAIFNRGVGAFEVTWLASDDWVEGPGKPNTPTADGVTWDDLATLVNSNLDTTLGIFTNAGADGLEAFSLALATNGNAVFVDGVTNQARFYRLSLSP